MLEPEWQSVQIQTPLKLNARAETIPLSRLYDSGFFVSEIFGSEVWVIDKDTYKSQTLQLFGKIPEKDSIWMRQYNTAQYELFSRIMPQ